MSAWVVSEQQQHSLVWGRLLYIVLPLSLLIDRLWLLSSSFYSCQTVVSFLVICHSPFHWICSFSSPTPSSPTQSHQIHIWILDSLPKHIIYTVLCMRRIRIEAHRTNTVEQRLQFEWTESILWMKTTRKRKRIRVVIMWHFWIMQLTRLNRGRFSLWPFMSCLIEWLADRSVLGYVASLASYCGLKGEGAQKLQWQSEYSQEWEERNGIHWRMYWRSKHGNFSSYSAGSPVKKAPYVTPHRVARSQ